MDRAGHVIVVGALNLIRPNFILYFSRRICSTERNQEQ